MQPILSCQRRKLLKKKVQRHAKEKFNRIYFVFVAFDVSRDLCSSTSAEHAYLGSNVRELVLLTIISIVNKQQCLNFTH